MIDKITFEEFYERYSVRRNPLKECANFDNTMLDFDDEEIDLIEEQDLQKVWTLVDENNKDGLVLKPGVLYKNNIIGYFICKNKWNMGEKNYILNY